MGDSRAIVGVGGRAQVFHSLACPQQSEPPGPRRRDPWHRRPQRRRQVHPRQYPNGDVPPKLGDDPDRRRSAPSRLRRPDCEPPGHLGCFPGAQPLSEPFGRREYEGFSSLVAWIRMGKESRADAHGDDGPDIPGPRDSPEGRRRKHVVRTAADRRNREGILHDRTCSAIGHPRRADERARSSHVRPVDRLHQLAARWNSERHLHIASAGRSPGLHQSDCGPEGRRERRPPHDELRLPAHDHRIDGRGEAHQGRGRSGARGAH